MFFGVDERPAHALDELVSLMLVREHLRGHMLGQHDLLGTSLPFSENLNSGHVVLLGALNGASARACLVVRLG